MGRNDFWSVVSIAAFLGIGVAGYYVINKFSKGGSSGFPDIQAIIDGIINTVKGGTHEGGDTTTTPPATTPPGTKPPPATTPGGGSTNNSQNTKFSVAGDFGSGDNNNWQSVVAQMQKFGPAVVVEVGDKSYRGGVPKWTPVVTAVKKFAKFIGVTGNHDGSGYGAGMDAYSNGVYNIGNCSFMLLDTENGSGSIAFAKANFSKMTGKWKIVAFHKPIKSPGSKHPADEGKIKALVPEFEKAKIDIVLSGHNHLYARFPPVNGVTYFVCGTGGEDHYAGSGGGAVKVDDKTFGTTNFTAGATVTGQFVSMSGQVIDTFTITKAAGALAKAYRSDETRPLYATRISVA